MVKTPLTHGPLAADVAGLAEAAVPAAFDTTIGPVSTESGPERLASVRVSELMSVQLVTVASEESIRVAARRMAEHRISCLPVVEAGRLVGLVTEADFVGRVVAEGRSVDDPVGSAMTRQPMSVQADQSVLDVLTLMTRYRVAHMPVCTGEQLIGIVTQTDVIRHQVASSVFMVGDIARMKTSQDIARIVRQLPRLLCTLVDSGSSAFETGRIISSITGAVTRRLLELAEQQLGPAPVPYLWLACGSQGRQEQTGTTDQDNCLMLDDRYEVSAHGDYFTQLADFVCDGLNESGFVYCPGNMMASNVQWRQPVRVWRDYFDGWIRRPDQTAQMLASVMFDLRAIHGDETLYEPLRQSVSERVRANSIFVAHMTSNSLAHRPSLGMFGRVRTESSGQYKGRVDLKHKGVVPIVDIARVHALAAGLSAVNTVERLSADVDSPVLSRSGARALLEAFEVLSMIRLRHQVQLLRRSLPADNYIDPATLGTSDRDRLRNSMKQIRHIQSAMETRVAVVGR